MDGKLCMMTGHHKIHHLWIFERWFILSWCSIHAWSNTSPTSWRGLIVKRGPFEFPPKFTPTISISQINIPKPRADSFFCVFCCSGERSVPDFLPSLIYLLFPWYFLLFALKDRVLIIVKWCTASSAHWGLSGWGGWEVLEGEGGKVRERWKVKGKRFNPPLSLKYFFLPLPPIAKIEKNHPGCERGIQIIDYWQEGRNPGDGGGRRSLTFPCWKDFICRESQIWEKARDELANTHPTTHPANLGLNFVAIIKNLRPNEESCL